MSLRSMPRHQMKDEILDYLNDKANNKDPELVNFTLDKIIEKLEDKNKEKVEKAIKELIETDEVLIEKRAEIDIYIPKEYAERINVRYGKFFHDTGIRNVTSLIIGIFIISTILSIGNNFNNAILFLENTLAAQSHPSAIFYFMFISTILSFILGTSIVIIYKKIINFFSFVTKVDKKSVSIMFSLNIIFFIIYIASAMILKKDIMPLDFVLVLGTATTVAGVILKWVIK